MIDKLESKKSITENGFAVHTEKNRINLESGIMNLDCNLDLTESDSGEQIRISLPSNAQDTLNFSKPTTLSIIK